jgi:hypothetical protein
MFVSAPVHNPYVRSSDGVHSRYRSAAADLWVTNSIIQQMSAHGVYRGNLLDQVTLGMTIEDIGRRIGPCVEDSEDRLAVAGLEGPCFDVAWRPNHPAKELDLRLPGLRFAPITWFFVRQSLELVQ